MSRPASHTESPGREWPLGVAQTSGLLRPEILRGGPQACGLPASRSQKRSGSLSAAGLRRTACRLEVCDTADRRSALRPKGASTRGVTCEEQVARASGEDHWAPCPGRGCGFGFLTNGIGLAGFVGGGSRRIVAGDSSLPDAIQRLFGGGPDFRHGVLQGGSEALDGCGIIGLKEAQS